MAIPSAILDFIFSEFLTKIQISAYRNKFYQTCMAYDTYKTANIFLLVLYIYIALAKITYYIQGRLHQQKYIILFWPTSTKPIGTKILRK